MAAPDQDFAAGAVDNYDFVKAVLGPDDQLLHILHAVNLHAIRPRVLRPFVEHRSCRDGILLLHWLSPGFHSIYKMLREAVPVPAKITSLARNLCQAPNTTNGKATCQAGSRLD